MLSEYNDTRNKFSKYLQNFGIQAESEKYAFSVKYKNLSVTEHAWKINTEHFFFRFRKMHKDISVAAPFLATYAAYVSQEIHDNSCSTLSLDHA